MAVDSRQVDAWGLIMPLIVLDWRHSDGGIGPRLEGGPAVGQPMEEESLSLKKTSLFLVGLLIALVALVAAGCGGSDGGSAPEALPSSSCTAIEYEGDGNPDYLIVSDLPLQGASRTQTLQIANAIRYELKKADYKAGDYKIGYQSCDDATAQAGKWDSGKCSQNANAYAANDKVIGIIGTFNSGCAGIIIPVVNQAPDGGHRDALARQHVRLPDAGGAGLRQDRAGQVLPVGHAELRSRRRQRRLPGRCRRRVRAVDRRQERVHPQRQGGLRSRRRDELQERRGVTRHQGRRLRVVRSEGIVVRGAVQQDQGHRSRRAYSSAA